MSNKMAFSPTTKGIYPTSPTDQKPYVEAGTLPDDLIDIPDEQYDAWANPPEGFYSVFDDNGPRAEPLLPVDHVAQAEKKREELQAEMQAATYTLNAKLLMGRTLSAAEKAKFNAWLDYSDALENLDLSTAPDVTWPTKPN